MITARHEKRLSFHWIALSLVVFQTRCIPFEPNDNPINEINQTLFDAINSYRIENGVPPLGYSTILETSITNHLEDMYLRDFFAHENSDGLSPGDRAIEAGFPHPYIGENLAVGQKDVDRVMEAWKESLDHNENMLNPDYVVVGIGHFVSPRGKHYWGQDFAFRY